MLYDSPPHRVSLSSSTPSNPTGGGAVLAYTVVQSAIPCLINTVGADTVARFAQSQIRVTHTIGILSSYLTSTPEPGWKAVADDTGDSYLIHGIRSGRISGLGTIPPLTYLEVEQLL